MSINSISSQVAPAVFQPEIFFLEEGIEEYPLAKDILSRHPGIPRKTFRDISTLTDEIKPSSYDVFGEGKKSLALTRFKGSFLKKCPGVSPGMVCCNYYVVNLSKNCTQDMPVRPAPNTTIFFCDNVLMLYRNCRNFYT